MRLKISLQRTKFSALPINYQYELSSWIYRVLHTGDPRFSEFLHRQGYSFEKKKFKLFTFSRLLLSEFKISGDRLILLNDEAAIVISFFIDDALLHFIKGLFMDQQLSLGDDISRVEFTVKNIESLPEPGINDEMAFRCLSPICVSRPRADNGKLRADYLSPQDPDFTPLLFENLVTKYIAATGCHMSQFAGFIRTTDIHSRFMLLSQPRSKLVTIKAHTPQETKVRGFEFDFTLKAPAELLKFGYASGFGEKNSLGFGCVEIRIPNPDRVLNPVRVME